MDEVRMVRDGYPEPAPPTAREISRAKALVNDSPRRSLPGLRWGLFGVAAAGAAAAVAFAVIGGNTPAPTPGPVRLDDKGAFLAAAEKAEQQPLGKYWYTDEVAGQSYVMRPKTGTYAITGAYTESFKWWGARSSTGEALYERGLPARPLTTHDAALWRKAGSPSSFPVWSNDHHYTYTTKATKWQVDDKNDRGGGEFLGEKSVEDLQNLPTDPDELAKMFLSQTEMSRLAAGIPPGRQPSAEMARKLQSFHVNPRAKVSRVAGLLGNAPIPPKVRAGLMRALAKQPGVHAIGHDTDPLGHQGIALASDDSPVTVTAEYGAPKAEQGTYRSRTVIIFDEHTGALLSLQDEVTRPGGPYSEMKPGFVINYTASRSAQWTDTKPTPPAGLPHG
jgi:hypothetical protein